MNLCVREDAQRAVNNLSPIPPTIRAIVLDYTNFWPRIAQLVRTTKPLVDAIGNVESRNAGLADCMLELTHCAQAMMRLDLGDNDDPGFWDHTKIVFNHRFHEMDTEHHGLALYLHPLCRRLAVSQAANVVGKSVGESVGVGVGEKWGWSIERAKGLQADLIKYHRSEQPFEGGDPDALKWWNNSRIDGQQHPLKAFALAIHHIVLHAAEIERVFSGLGCTQSPRRCRLNLDTFEKLGKIRTNLHSHLHSHMVSIGRPVHRKHAHMRTREEGGSNVVLAQDLERTFTWKPPLATEGGITDPFEAPEDIMVDELDRAFKEFEGELQREANDPNADRDKPPSDAGSGVLEGRSYSFEELDRVNKGVAPEVLQDDLKVIEDAGDDAEWDIADLVSRNRAV
ncbi:uncharacterized protein BXZ73DRAFT_53938 [Epithele typhae]|uniref:uncharacterized protein n=1 Tax=Epithele typhae TaxID=378194 RepID=UPI0020078C62|nr:uncharacterized protein BXZ73DRAFT_53938 [Epithele typhae]KAH9916114.1 hypothetical protein BXZ73DRAFT_53938 [Epithele typhae]